VISHNEKSGRSLFENAWKESDKFSAAEATGTQRRRIPAKINALSRVLFMGHPKGGLPDPRDLFTVAIVF
jgi:hypothetical protein